MSKPTSNDLDTRGYFLPEDSQSRLKKLRDHMQFLSGLAQPRTWKEEQERAPEVPVDHLATCLELLAEQADLVLQDVSWPARREVAADAPDRDVTAATSPETSDTAVERFAIGVTGEQVDLLDRLLGTISAQGDVTAADPAAEPADPTVPPLAQAIHDGARAVRDLLDQVEAQRPGRMPRRPTGVGEERAVYATGLACPMSAPVLPMPDASPSRSVRLH
ncbi:hypothetical protein CSC74_16085 [Pseudoxanthomonas yeongjuensis]|uniref:XAC0095 family protein n=1 Tax=Pseudoxanthomonas yeongjuensis TaxID=377616 RepID=UPI0013920FA0|nr:hypothetical protein [Pseudoxanthomonas yeongjuensis]KAF1714448.1 hypothetical protein CSC74_16085 [Pseudoxanthomonas yeongjuensis]